MYKIWKIQTLPNETATPSVPQKGIGCITCTFLIFIRKYKRLFY